jgi:hypothetical protein
MDLLSDEQLAWLRHWAATFEPPADELADEIALAVAKAYPEAVGRGIGWGESPRMSAEGVARAASLAALSEGLVLEDVIVRARAAAHPAAVAAGRRLSRRGYRGLRVRWGLQTAEGRATPRATTRARAPRARRAAVRRRASLSSSDDDPPSDLVLIPLSAFRKDVDRWLRGAAA